MVGGSGRGPMPESIVWIDTTPDGMILTAELPLNRLEFSFGQPLTNHSGKVLQSYGDALSAYLLQHVGVRSDGKGWQVLRPTLSGTGTPRSEERQARFILRAPNQADPRAPEPLYDVITHEVHTHRVQVFLRNDWKSGFVRAAPIMLGELNHDTNALILPLGAVSSGSGFISLLGGGMTHIAQGTDHLLFLMLLLLVAPLAAQVGRWSGVRSLQATVRHTTFVITAFTTGHTVTLILGSTGLLKAPSGSVEVAVALTIAIAAIHAWRPYLQVPKPGWHSASD